MISEVVSKYQEMNLIDKYKETFAKRLFKERTSNPDLSQDILAEFIGVTRQTIANWENIQSPSFPNMCSLIKLCEVFNCTVAYFIGEYDNRTIDQADIKTALGLDDDTIGVLMQSKHRHDNNICGFPDYDLEIAFTNYFIQNREKFTYILDRLITVKKYRALLDNDQYLEYYKKAAEGTVYAWFGKLSGYSPIWDNRNTAECNIYIENLKKILKEENIVLDAKEEERVTENAKRYLYCIRNDDSYNKFRIIKGIQTLLDDFLDQYE